MFNNLADSASDMQGNPSAEDPNAISLLDDHKDELQDVTGNL